MKIAPHKRYNGYKVCKRERDFPLKIGSRVPYLVLPNLVIHMNKHRGSALTFTLGEFFIPF